MSDEKVRELLAELGLSGYELGEAGVVELPESLVGQALGLPRLADLRALVMGPVVLAVLAAAGIEAHVSADGSRVAKFLSPSPDVPLAVRTLSGGGGVLPSDEKDVVWVDLRSVGAFLLEGGGHRVVCVVEGDRLTVRELVRAVALEPLATVPAPEGWLGMTGDAWLNEQVGERLAVGDSWSVGVAAGMQARLTEPAVPVAPGGVPDASITQPRLWMRSLPAAEASTLERLALAEVDRLNGMLDELLSVPEDADLSEDWCSDWLRACESRDDLEGMRLLLSEAGRAEALSQQLALVDRAGSSLRMRAPLATVAPGERLRRARLIDPDAWWGWLA